MDVWVKSCGEVVAILTANVEDNQVHIVVVEVTDGLALPVVYSLDGKLQPDGDGVRLVRLRLWELVDDFANAAYSTIRPTNNNRKRGHTSCH